MAKKIQMVMNPMEGESCVFGQFRGIGLGAGLSLATVASCKLCSACQPSASLRALSLPFSFLNVTHFICFCPGASFQDARAIYPRKLVFQSRVSLLLQEQWGKSENQSLDELQQQTHAAELCRQPGEGRKEVQPLLTLLCKHNWAQQHLCSPVRLSTCFAQAQELSLIHI